MEYTTRGARALQAYIAANPQNVVWTAETGWTDGVGCVCRLGPDCPRPGRCDDSAVAAAEDMRERCTARPIPAETRECRHCQTTLHLEASAPLDEYVWVDSGNGRFGEDTDLPPDPYGRLQALGERMAASKYKDMAAACEYSSLKVRLEMGTTHEHYPASNAPIQWGLAVPEHCGWPMWLRPSGWHCRQRCGTVLGHTITAR